MKKYTILLLAWSASTFAIPQFGFLQWITEIAGTVTVYDTTLTSTHTPSCYIVAVHNETATTALSDVDECHTNKRKRRSIVADKPLWDTWNKDIIQPTSSATATRRNGTLEAGPSSDAVEQRANNEANRRARLFGGLFGIRVRVNSTESAMIGTVTRTATSTTTYVVQCTNSLIHKPEEACGDGISLPFFSYEAPDTCSKDEDCESPHVCGTDDTCREACDGDNSCCSKGFVGFCKEGEGDCDSDHECEGSLVCGDDNCAWGSDDCCRNPQGDEGKSCQFDNNCAGDLVCGHDSLCRNPCDGANSCCSQGIAGYCKEGEGDCDSDDECEGDLKCGTNNCSWGSSSDDCCISS